MSVCTLAYGNSISVSFLGISEFVVGGNMFVGGPV